MTTRQPGHKSSNHQHHRMRVTAMVVGIAILMILISISGLAGFWSAS